MARIAFDVPEEVLVQLGCDATSLAFELRLLAAASWHGSERLSLRRAAQLAGVPEPDFHEMIRSFDASRREDLESRLEDREVELLAENWLTLVPPQVPRLPGWDLSVHFHPSRSLARDLYDLIPIDEDRLGIVVLSSSAGGFRGLVSLAVVFAVLRAESERNPSTAEALVKANRILAQTMRRGDFVSCIYALLNQRTRTFLMSNGGHVPGILIRHGGQTCEDLLPRGIALGFDPGPIFERTVEEQQWTLRPGDRLCIHSGLNEMTGRDHTSYGETRLHDLCVSLAGRSSNEFLAGIVEAFQAFLGESEPLGAAIVTTRLLPSGVDSATRQS